MKTSSFPVVNIYYDCAILELLNFSLYFIKPFKRLTSMNQETELIEINKKDVFIASERPHPEFGQILHMAFQPGHEKFLKVTWSMAGTNSYTLSVHKNGTFSFAFPVSTSNQTLVIDIENWDELSIGIIKGNSDEACDIAITPNSTTPSVEAKFKFTGESQPSITINAVEDDTKGNNRRSAKI